MRLACRVTAVTVVVAEGVDARADTGVHDDLEEGKRSADGVGVQCEGGGGGE